MITKALNIDIIAKLFKKMNERINNPFFKAHNIAALQDQKM